MPGALGGRPTPACLSARPATTSASTSGGGHDVGNRGGPGAVAGAHTRKLGETARWRLGRALGKRSEWSPPPLLGSLLLPPFLGPPPAVAVAEQFHCLLLERCSLRHRNTKRSYFASHDPRHARPRLPPIPPGLCHEDGTGRSDKHANAEQPPPRLSTFGSRVTHVGLVICACHRLMGTWSSCNH